MQKKGQTDRQTDGQTDGETDRQTDGRTVGGTDRQDRRTDRQFEIESSRLFFFSLSLVTQSKSQNTVSILFCL